MRKGPDGESCLSPGAQLVLALLLVAGQCAHSLAAEPDIRAYPLLLQFSAEAPLAPPNTAPAATVDGAVEGAMAEAAVADQRMAYAQPPAQLLATAAALVQKARQAGSVRVIVGVNTSFTPSGMLSPAAENQQRQGIGLAQQALLESLKGTAATPVRRFRDIPFIALQVSAEALELLAALPLVLSIEESVAEPPGMASSNPVIGSPAAWADGYDGTGQVVAVLDTGVDKTHPFFALDSKVVSEACFSSTSLEDDYESLCPGGASSSTASGSALNCPIEVAGCSHGTHVAGTAVGNDHVGPNYGVARGAKLIAVQVFSRFDNQARCGTPPCALSFPDDQIAGLARIYELRNTYSIAAVNMSLGGGSYGTEGACDFDQSARKAAIDTLRSVGIATIISSGNNGYKNATAAPGCISTAVEVAATTDEDVVDVFSNIAAFVELLAPGVSIESSVPGGITATFTGTSMAAPHVTGAWAVMKQRFPADSIDDVLARLQGSGKSVDDTRSGGVVTDMRRIRLELAVETITGFTLFNDGDAVLDVTSIAPDSAAPWIDLSPLAPFSIPAGGSQTLTVTIDHAQAPAGISMRRLLIASNDPDENPLPGGVDIKVTRPDGPEFDSSPAAGFTHDFGVVEVGGVSALFDVTVENTGAANLTLSCALGGAEPGEFSIDQCPPAAAAGESVHILVSCQPLSTGDKGAVLELTSNDLDESNTAYYLTCTPDDPIFADGFELP